MWTQYGKCFDINGNDYAKMSEKNNNNKVTLGYGKRKTRQK